ncbi:hypothetical protein PFICI_07270 [Pestalotiopsis fici W106-1]|uniref:DUF6536 domain-containing protein n=1 Tax=Pestalotiopsis fici (strain W106-1 / CGMCC3.15140) TaxID=1229662 RepID=W3X837_PESFW|nr:uncharacterized protein PFICI_07270 [Pestalotiopsis fici W106-1]ETS82268.1 hypothetical protein PFICI_07270 [Pestalotiopsis fici W106-1]
MDGVIPARHGNGAPVRYTWDEEGAVRNIEPLEKVRERTEGLSSHGRHTARDSRSRINWPFHHHTTSEVPSTSYTASHFGHFRRATAQTKSWFKDAGDSASVLSRSLVPDYVVHYMRGETPETLARKREQARWGEKDIILTPQRERLRSQQAFFEDPFGSQINLAGNYGGYGQGQRGLGRFMVGWRGGVAFNALMALIFLLVAVVCFALVSSKIKVFGGDYILLSGFCSTVSSYNALLHALINILCIILLAGGNYVFQLLSSPTRDELTEAHDKKKWLDIGIPSIRNLPHISGLRATIAAIVVLTVVATQVIYNAIIFTSQTAAETCDLNTSSALLGIVALLNLVTFGSIVAVMSRSRFKPLATLGDFISSFLCHPDATTKSACLLSKKDVKAGSWGYSEAKYFSPSTHLWLFTPSALRWLLMVFSWLLLAAPTVAAIGLFVPTDPDGISTPFGTSTSYTTFPLPTSITKVQMAVLACLPQVLLAILYMVTNSHLTTYYLSHELSLFALGPRPLRVSCDARGAQVASLYMTLPRPISWGLLAFFAAMGFVLSQAVFPDVITETSLTATANQVPVLAVAFSVQALVVLLALLGALMMIIVGLGLRRAPGSALVNGRERGNPLALRGGSCSAALSAKCHPAPGENEPWTQELTWGVVSDGLGMEDSCCGFSALSVGAVDVGRAYA